MSGKGIVRLGIWMKQAVRRLGATTWPRRWKESKELAFWKAKVKTDGVLANHYYRHFCTTHFGLAESYYDGKVILDIGCGPRGSLEWASMAARRVGLDPLAKEYLKLGANQHKMEYVDSPSENIPMKDGACDVVFSFNSLDHVADVERTVSEIKRVTRLGGLFLLLVEVNHKPTECEPHELTPKKLIELLKPQFVCEDLQVYRPVDPGMYRSIRADEKFDSPGDTKEPGWMSARFVRTANESSGG
ncbi:MAG: class I SAM-dependent methyltransferase [Sedimentisphaerales bacterium]|nr:class I SAM-dependent methyltransferase [Sedimentisphaerales bacterium]